MEGKKDQEWLSWLGKHVPLFVKESTEEEARVVAHTLVYSEEFEKYVYLNFKNTSLVISLKHDDADCEILRVRRVNLLDLAPLRLPLEFVAADLLASSRICCILLFLSLL